ncbi:MAG: hypothetical protein ACE5KW_03485 [Dehalococcoidia bacterium]
MNSRQQVEKLLAGQTQPLGRGRALAVAQKAGLPVGPDCSLEESAEIAQADLEALRRELFQIGGDPALRWANTLLAQTDEDNSNGSLNSGEPASSPETAT